MRRRVDLACGLVTAPEVVFLDEPTTGLDPRSRQDVWSLVERLRDQGVTILLTTQYLEEADLLSDEIVVIGTGRIIASGTAEQLKAQTGGTFCDVTPAHLTELPHLESVLADLPSVWGPPQRRVPVSARSGGADVLVEIVRRTTEAGIDLADITMRRPSLDDVFLALTSPGAPAPQSDDGADGRPGGSIARSGRNTCRHPNSVRRWWTLSHARHSRGRRQRRDHHGLCVPGVPRRLFLSAAAQHRRTSPA